MPNPAGHEMKLKRKGGHLRRTDAQVDNAVGLRQLQHGSMSHDALGVEGQGSG